MNYLYGKFTPFQIAQTKEALHRSIHWLLLYKDPRSCSEFSDIDVDHCFNSIMLRISGLNELLGYQPILVSLLSILQAARSENQKENFDFDIYRKLILDAHSLVDRIKEDDDDKSALQKTPAP